MSCAVFTGLGAYVLYAGKSNAWTLWATFGIAIAFLFVASYLAWKDQRRKTLDEMANRIRLERESGPNILLRIGHPQASKEMIEFINDGDDSAINVELEEDAFKS